ncbi:MAG TPA: hypothetical protein VJ799_01200 [Nitrososphaeraceae archaeon]|nr:hypothetical protein [Nitrososphaeraceae archaeon]
MYRPLLSKSRTFTSEKHAALVVFILCIALRAAPELIAYPYPIGYDVINYYIPTVTNFEDKWDIVSKQFPLYVTFLYIVSITTGLPAYSVIVAVIIAMTGIFGVSIFYLGRTLLKLGISHSVFIAIFAILQLAVLRTTWDFHRDIFALTTMIFVFSLLSRNNAGWKPLALILGLTTLTVAADRMVGALFSVSVAVYAIVTRRRDIALTGILAIAMFYALAVSTQSTPDIKTITSTEIPQNNKELKEFYNPIDLLLFFIVVNGLLLAAAAIGFLNIKNTLLKIPLLVCLMGSFSWLAFPENRYLLADRWIILAGIFLSVFAGYGILHLIRNLRRRFTIAGCILGAFAVLGVSFAVIPHHSATALYGIIGLHSEHLPPLTMQFNSIDVEDNDELLSAIAWINKNTEQDALIVGQNHWRGFMELYLENERTYHFSEDPQTTAEALSKRGQQVYLIEFSSTSPTLFVVKDINNR